MRKEKAAAHARASIAAKEAAEKASGEIAERNSTGDLLNGLSTFKEVNEANAKAIREAYAKAYAEEYKKAGGT
jgi:hypothetical protein